MASGFGYFHSSDNIVAGYGNIYVSGNITQSVDSANRKVTITVQAFLTYYRRTGGNWNPGTAILFENDTNGNYLRATLDGSSVSDGTHLGLRGQNTTLVVGNYYDRHTGGVASWDISMVTKSATFNYAASGAAITKSWSCSTNYAGSVISLSGSVTTDSIPATGDPPSAGYMNDLSSTYVNGLPTIYMSSAGVNDGGLSLSTLQFYVSTLPYSAVAPARYLNFSNGAALSVSNGNTTMANDGDNIEFNKSYYTGIYAVNTKGGYRYAGPRVTTVPAPALYYLTETGADNIEISYATTVDYAALPVIIQYSTDGGTNWQDGPTIADTSVERRGKFIIDGLTPGTSYTIRLRTSTSAGSTETGSIPVVTHKATLYGSVNGDSEKIIKLYGSVGGESKAIKKLYGSVNGRAKLIYKEN